MALDRTVAALHALAHGTRMRVLQELAKAGEGGLTAGVVATRVEVQKNALSPHLALLQRARLVTSERAGRNITYRLQADTLMKLSVELQELGAAE